MMRSSYLLYRGFIRCRIPLCARVFRERERMNAVFHPFLSVRESASTQEDARTSPHTQRYKFEF